MSTTHNLPFVRFVKRAETPPRALLSTDVAANEVYERLKVAPWTQIADELDSSFPARFDVLTTGTPRDDFDAYKYVGDYSSGYQKAYAGAVAYRFKIPADAQGGTPDNIVSAAIPLHVDRWLIDGVRLAMLVSDSPAPPVTWATIRDGDKNATAQLTGLDPKVEQTATVTLTPAAPVAADKFLYVMVTLEDYETTRDFWIEGAALIRGDAVVTTFDATVTADDPLPDEDYSLVMVTIPHIEKSGTVAFVPITSAAADLRKDNILQMRVGLDAYTDTSLAASHVKQAFFWNSPTGTTITSSAATVADITHQSAAAEKGIFIRQGLQLMTGGVPAGGIVREMICDNAIGEYPEWMEIRMNLYARAMDGTPAPYAASIMRGFMATNYNAWMNGTYSGDDAICLMSAILSPYGHVAKATFAGTGASLGAGVWGFYLSLQIANIVGEPDLTDATTNGLSHTPTHVYLRIE